MMYTHTLCVLCISPEAHQQNEDAIASLACVSRGLFAFSLRLVSSFFSCLTITLSISYLVSFFLTHHVFSSGGFSGFPRDFVAPFSPNFCFLTFLYVLKLVFLSSMKSAISLSLSGAQWKQLYNIQNYCIIFRKIT